jgi:diguanylate cyclase (GGDEF)-like protein/PAS domain S-box-containing protein
MEQPHRLRRFFSLKWKVSLSIGLLFLVLSGCFVSFNYLEMRRQFGERRGSLQRQYALQAQGLLDLSARRLTQLGTMVASLSGIQSALPASGRTDFSGTSLDALSSILQLSMGVETIELVDAAGVALWEQPMPARAHSGRFVDAVRAVVATERPEVLIDCTETCLQYAIVPVMGRDLSGAGALILGISLADVVLDFQRVSGTDLGLIVETQPDADPISDAARWLEPWHANVVALTNFDRYIDLLWRLTPEVGRLEQLRQPTQVQFGDRDLELQLFPLTGFGRDHGHLLVIADITEAMGQIRSAVKRGLLLGGGGFGASLVVLVIILWRPLSRIRRATEFLPRLAEGEFQEVRAGIVESGPYGWFSDEVNVLNDTTVALSRQLERLNAEVAERMREITAERNLVTQVLDSAQVIILTQDSELGILRVNRHGSKLLGLQDHAVYFPDLLEPPSARDLMAAWLMELIAGKRDHFEAELDVRCSDGNVIDVVWQHSRLPDGDGANPVILSVGMDITARKAAEVRLAWLADHDPLTGLYNRRRFEEELEHAIQLTTRYGHAGALVFLDLDQFKYVNDTSGHRAGDDLLKSLSTSLPGLLRAEDIVGRLGGDEFAIILNQVDREGAIDVAKKIQAHVAAMELSVGERTHKVTASLGIALFPEHGKDVQELLARADLAMYQVKDSGRGGWYVLSSDDQSQQLMNERVLWKQRLERAIADDRFLLYVQPIVAVADLSVTHYEVLLRMRGDDGNILGPTQFISVAERSGLIHDIDRLVLAKSIRALAQAHACGMGLTFTVNLSAHAFNDPSLVGHLEQHLREARLDPRWVVLEMTETAALSDLVAARRLMERINALGCRFALDDFGTGFSSFFYLKHLPFDFIKIDGSFISNLPERPDDQVLVKAMAQIAMAYRKKCVAEHVDAGATMDLLREFQIDFAQGYYHGRPIPIEQMLASAPSRSFAASR